MGVPPVDREVPEMDARRWVLVVVLVAVVIGLLAFARGPEHHHGQQQVGAFGDGAPGAAAARG